MAQSRRLFDQFEHLDESNLSLIVEGEEVVVELNDNLHLKLQKLSEHDCNSCRYERYVAYRCSLVFLDNLEVLGSLAHSLWRLVLKVLRQRL